MGSKLCAYCGKNKVDNEITKEHVVPKAIGGAISSKNPLVIDACKVCNNAAGYHIDAPFIKSWFMAISKSLYARNLIDLEKQPILPLKYMGKLKGVSYEDKICDMWLGPTGDTIYHFHNPYPTIKNTPPMVELHPALKNSPKVEIDEGFCFLFLASNNVEWIPTIIKSFVSQFSGAVKYSGNLEISGDYNPFTDIPENHIHILQKLKSMQGKSHNVEVQIGIDTGDRFLVKLALGFGALELDKSFLVSPDAIKLRNFMWQSDIEKRKGMPLFGSGFTKGLNGIEPIKDLLKWENGHLFMLLEVGGHLALYSSLYGQNAALISISSDSKHWNDKFKRGIVYIIVPFLQKLVKLTLPELIAHKTPHDKYIHETLDELEREEQKITSKALPPFKLKND